MATRKSIVAESTGGITPEVAFGRVLKERRKELGYTQVDLEVRSEIGRSYISELENGSKQVCLRSLLRLAYALDLQPEELLARVVGRIDPKTLFTERK